MRERSSKGSVLSPAIQSRLIISCFTFIALLLSVSISQEDVQTRWVLSGLLLGMNMYIAKALTLHLTYKRSKRIRTWSLMEKLRLGIYLFVTLITIGASESFEVYGVFTLALGLVMVHKYSSLLSFKNLNSNHKMLANNEIDQMTEEEFMTFIVKLYEGLGYSTQIPPSKREGASYVLIKKKKVKTAIRLKLAYSNERVKVETINEMLRDVKDWDIDRKVVLTNRRFSPKAIKTAERCGVTLINQEGLLILTDQYKKEMEQGKKRRRLSFQKRSGE
ncbi:MULTISPECIES: restriction endonuclease [Pontibacillus]|uniref:Restriction endonuclease n=1 Tax=Pontibacillus chungwhensis TaxID=265426 RepID=A0ABY8UVX9_9BACI|nr:MULTISPECIES: restriction endonuclease [Pontibacillus]MCD5323193.1 restriction endonuclease [Pontibacillus sp. HN14]WIF96580.1 restriction endonuclease [Pontibacillus chungwhensis]